METNTCKQEIKFQNSNDAEAISNLYTDASVWRSLQDSELWHLIISISNLYIHSNGKVKVEKVENSQPPGWEFSTFSFSFKLFRLRIVKVENSQPEGWEFSTCYGLRILNKNLSILFSFMSFPWIAQNWIQMLAGSYLSMICSAQTSQHQGLAESIFQLPSLHHSIYENDCNTLSIYDIHNHTQAQEASCHSIGRTYNPQRNHNHDHPCSSHKYHSRQGWSSQHGEMEHSSPRKSSSHHCCQQIRPHIGLPRHHSRLERLCWHPREQTLTPCYRPSLHKGLPHHSCPHHSCIRMQAESRGLRGQRQEKASWKFELKKNWGVNIFPQKKPRHHAKSIRLHKRSIVLLNTVSFTLGNCKHTMRHIRFRHTCTRSRHAGIRRTTCISHSIRHTRRHASSLRKSWIAHSSTCITSRSWWQHLLMRGTFCGRVSTVFATLYALLAFGLFLGIHQHLAILLLAISPWLVGRGTTLPTRPVLQTSEEQFLPVEKKPGENPWKQTFLKKLSLKKHPWNSY